MTQPHHMPIAGEGATGPSKLSGEVVRVAIGLPNASGEGTREILGLPEIEGGLVREVFGLLKTGELVEDVLDFFSPIRAVAHGQAKALGKDLVLGPGK
ncbi:hypothetical protein AMTR_s00177p00023230 [Amborella trichopoda]|uniref:Uncharacterized protein n=1 Tax=Amborella trichopoda TaxID=13333 RepID=W1PQF0_AMBTC|nr:hypothetical protein AMTR_s00177p00023230 [Amborella trichopoda]